MMVATLKGNALGRPNVKRFPTTPAVGTYRLGSLSAYLPFGLSLAVPFGHADTRPITVDFQQRQSVDVAPLPTSPAPNLDLCWHRRSAQLGRSPRTSSAGSTSSAAATRTSVSSVGLPLPNSRWLIYVRWTSAISARASWLTGGSSFSRYARMRFPNSKANASLIADRAFRALAIRASRVVRARMGLQKTSRAAKVEAMRRKGLALLTAVVATVGLTGFFVVPGAGASSHPSYPLGKAKSCKAGYSKVTIKKSETVRIKVHGKWKVEHKTIRTVECVYVAPKKSTPTTSTSATTTTTVGHPTSTSTSTTTSTTTTTLTPASNITPTISFATTCPFQHTPRRHGGHRYKQSPTRPLVMGLGCGTSSFAFSNYYTAPLENRRGDPCNATRKPT